MSPLATVVLAWAAVYAYVGAYFCMLYARKPNDREYLHFGLLAAFVSVYAVGDVVFLSEASYARQALGIQMMCVASSASLTLFVEFCISASGGPRSRLVPTMYAWALVGLAAAAARLVVVPATSRSPWLALPGTTAPLAVTSNFAVGYFAVGLTMAALALRRLAANARVDYELRILYVAMAINVAAAVHDLVLRSGWIHSYTLVSHTLILAIFSMCFVLLDRFARTVEALRLRTFELSASRDELRTTHERLARREALAAVGELSAVIAHEVRNPLAVIKNAVSGLRRPKLRPQDRTTLLGILDEETGRLYRLMRDLLAYARPITPNPRTVDVEELVRDALDVSRANAPATSGELHLEIDLDRAPPTLFGDPVLLGTALSNVIDNALQAMPHGGVLGVRGDTRRVAGRAAVGLVVSDTGTGMEPVVCAKAPAPFFTTRPQGTGLGLPIVEKVLRNHGGTLALESALGSGTRVTLVIPCDPIGFGAVGSSDGPGSSPRGERHP